MALDPTPIAVPGALQALAAHHPVALTALRQARQDVEKVVEISERDIELVRIGALIGVGAPPESVTAHVRRALDVGLTASEIWDAVAILSTIVGVPRLIAVVPVIDAALMPQTGDPADE